MSEAELKRYLERKESQFNFSRYNSIFAILGLLLVILSLVV